MTGERSVREMLDDLNRTQQEFHELLAALGDDVLYRRAGEEWTLAEELAHICEARQFWAGEVRKVQAQSGTAIGRSPDDPQRLQTIVEHGHDSLDEIRARLSASHARVRETLSAVRAEELQRTGVHARFGEQSLGWIIQRFLVEHDRSHVQQARASLEASQRK